MAAKQFYQQKTFWAGLAMLGWGVVQAVTTGFTVGIQDIIGGAAIIFGRQAIEGIKSE